jgi:hypothetical protein
MSFIPPSPARYESNRQADHEVDARAREYAATHPKNVPAHEGPLGRLWARLRGDRKQQKSD